MHSFSKFVSAALAFGLLLSQVATTCTRPLQRKEWYVTSEMIGAGNGPVLGIFAFWSFLSYRRTLRTSEKQAYIKAVGCMQTKPGLLGDLYPGVRSRFDDFLGLHINQTDFIHFVVCVYPITIMSLSNERSLTIMEYTGILPTVRGCYCNPTCTSNTNPDGIVSLSQLMKQVYAVNVYTLELNRAYLLFSTLLTTHANSRAQILGFALPF
jgi:hypothetical protein